MKEHLKRLASHSIIYGMGDVVGRLVSFLLLPIVLRYLGPHDYGDLEIFRVLKNICVMLLPLGLESAIFRYYFKSTDPSEQGRILGTAFWVVAPLCTGFFLVSVLCRVQLSTLFWGTPELALHVTVVTGTICLEALKTLPMSLLRTKERSVFYSVVNVVNVVVNLGLNILFLVVFKLGVLAILLGGLCSALLIVLLVGPTFARYVLYGARQRYVVLMLKYGMPLAFVSLTFNLIGSLDRFFIQHFRSPEELGIYALGVRFVTLLNLLLITPFSLAWLPFAFSLEKESNSKGVYSSVLTYFLLIGLMMGLLICLLTPEVIRLISPEAYWGNYRFVVPLTLGTIALGVYRNVALGIALKEKTVLVMIAGLAALGTNIVLNYIFVPTFGVMGAAASNLIAYAVLALTTLGYAQRLYYIRYEYGRLLHQVLVFLAVLTISFRFQGYSLWVRTGLKLVLIGCFPVLLYVTGFFHRDELSAIRSSLARRPLPPSEG
jgi:O-antigen/teichoic acid export membrane protein